MAEAWDLKRFRRPNFHDRVRPDPCHGVCPEPPCRHIWHNSDNRVRRPVERDASPNHIRFTSHPFLPEIFRNERNICALFFLRQEIAAENGANAQHIEIVGGQSAAKYLDWIPKSGQRECKEILRSETVKNRLAVAINLVTRGRY